MQIPYSTEVDDIYGVENLKSCIKMVTVAPELVGSSELISSLRQNHRMVISLVCISEPVFSSSCNLRLQDIFSFNRCWRYLRRAGRTPVIVVFELYTRNSY